MTDEYKNDVKNRSVYIKGLAIDTTPEDTKEWSSVKYSDEKNIAQSI